MTRYGIQAVGVNDDRHKRTGQYILHQIFHIGSVSQSRSQHHHVSPFHLGFYHLPEFIPAFHELVRGVGGYDGLRQAFLENLTVFLHRKQFYQSRPCPVCG